MLKYALVFFMTAPSLATFPPTITRRTNHEKDHPRPRVHDRCNKRQRVGSCYVKKDHTALLTTPINKRVVAYVNKDEQIFLLGEMNYDFDTNDDWWLIETNRADNNADGWVRRSSLMHCVRGTHADEYTEGGRK